MVLEYSIVGGHIKLPKSIFIQEMLSKDSTLKSFIKWSSTAELTKHKLYVSEPDEDNNVTIRFDTDCNITCSESPRDILSALKNKYQSKIKGKVACRIYYSTFGGIFDYEVDLD